MLSLDSAGTARWMPRLLVKPDTMSEEHFVHYKTFISPYIVGARLSPDDDNLELRLSLPMPVREEKHALEAMTPSFSLRWDAVKQNFVRSNDFFHDFLGGFTKSSNFAGRMGTCYAH